MTRENTLSDGKRILKVSSIALIIGAMITPLMLGGITVYRHSEKKLKLNVEKSNAAAIRRFEWMLDNASSSAKAFSSLSDKPCSQIVEALRRQAASVPFARSVLLVRNNIMYCSTIYGQLDEPIDYSVFTEGTLLLRMDDHLIPGGVVILFRVKNHSGDMVFNIDGQVAAHFLNQGESTPATEISIGNTSLRRDGVMSVAPQNTSIVAFSTSKSNNYPFSISGGYEHGVVWRHVRENYLHYLILFAGMGLVAAYGTKKLIHRSHNIKSDILRGLQRNEFIPYYQPLVNSESRECSGVEVLVRWQHPRVGIVTPAFFVPWMEKTGLIKEMTLNLFNSVEKDLSKIATQLSKNFHISINISPENISDTEIFEQCQNFLTKFSSFDFHLVLELTERIGLEPSDELKKSIMRLRAAGVLIALDDFGVGHPNLSALREFPVDIIKIDRDFIAQLKKTGFDEPFIDSIVSLARQLKIQVIAEGIETKLEAEILTQKGVPMLQGYYFSQPLPIEKLKAFLKITAAT